MAEAPNICTRGPDRQGLHEPRLAWPGAESCTMEREQGVQPPNSQKHRAFLETGLPGILAHWTSPGRFLFSLFPLRTSDSLSRTCLCGYLRGEMVTGLEAMGRSQAPVRARGQR